MYERISVWKQLCKHVYKLMKFYVKNRTGFSQINTVYSTSRS
jgi:hypothetical protein